ncbi:MAG: hypothetical protein ACXWKC_00540 [Xanthobacteraceae bacterium]
MASSEQPATILASLTAGVDPVTARDVRRAIYSHDVLTSADMDLVFEVARRAGSKPCAEWISIFCESVTDFVVHQNAPRDYISQQKADWLAAKLAGNGGIASKSEFDMLIDVMTHALGVPPSLSAFALREIKTAIIEGRRDIYSNEDHPSGSITKDDVEAIRAVLYAATTGSPGHVTQDEAEVLFEIAHATAGAKVDPSFDDLFARAIGNYLMAINWHVPDAGEALHREKWLDEEESLSGFMSRILHGTSGSSSFNVMMSPAEAFDADLAKRDAEDRMLRSETEQITKPEADWVLAHLNREGELTSSERRLLQFLGTEAPSVPALLRTLIEKLGLGSAASRVA